MFTKKNAPDAVKALPSKAMDIWIAAYNSAHEQYEGDEAKCNATAWAAVKTKYEQDDAGKWKLAEAISMSDMGQMLYDAVKKRFGDMAYIKETYPEDKYIIVCSSGDGKTLLKVSYSVDNDDVSLAHDTIPVKQEENYIELTESYQLIEAKDAQGLVWDVVVIDEGLSDNGNYYTDSALKNSANLFEGARVFARTDAEHTKDVNASINNVVGWLSEVSYKGKQLVGKLNLSEAEGRIRSLLVDAWNRGKKDLAGLSIVAEGKTTRKKIGSRMVAYVETIERVISTDLVMNPAAGGKLVKLVASQDPGINKQEEEGMKKEQLLKLIEAKSPGLLKGVDRESVTAEQLVKLLSEAAAKEGAEKESAKLLLAEAEKAQKAVEAEAAKLAEAKSKLAEAEKGALEVLAEAKKERQLAACDRVLTSKLAEAGLPKLTADRIRERFSESVFETAELEKVIGSERDYLAKLSESGKVTGMGGQIKVGPGQVEKQKTALDGFFNNADVDGVSRYRSFREAYIEITGDKYITGKLSEAKNLSRFSEALQVSSWAEILADAVNKKMLAEYRMPALQDWRKIVSDITPITNFQSNKRMQMGGYGTLPGVDEAGAYAALSSPGDQEATYSVSKKGGLETITMEMIANDEVGSIRRIPTRLARAGAQTLYRAVFDLLSGNATITTDSTALFTSGHGNLSTVALSATELLARKVAMGSQTAYGDSSETLGLIPKYLIVPLELEDTAYRLTSSVSLIGATNNAGTEPNLHSSYGLTPLVVPYLTDATDWFLCCDPQDCPTIEVGFYNGQEEPELLVQDMPNVGSMFTNDQITYKIRHIWGVCLLDHRGFQGNYGVA